MKKAEEAKLREEIRQVYIENTHLRHMNDFFNDCCKRDLERLFTEQWKCQKLDEKLFNRTAFFLTMMSLCVFGFLLIAFTSKAKIEEMELQLIEQSEEKFEPESISRPIIEHLNSQKEWEAKQYCE